MKTVCALLASLVTVFAVAYAGPVTLELKSGSTIKGELVSWDGEQATVRADFGDVKLSKAQLSQSALSELALSSGDSSALKAKIKELQSTVESLRRDNEALRDQIASSTSLTTAPVAPTSASGITEAPSSSPAAGGFWISSTGKRHNANCRYYQTSRGRPGSSGEGVACKICGG